MTTEAAQRRLLEALAVFHNTPDLDTGLTDPLGALHVGILEAAQFFTAMGQPALVAPYLAFADLVDAVRTDHQEMKHHD